MIFFVSSFNVYNYIRTGNICSDMGVFYWIYCIVALMVMVRVVLNNRDSVKTLAWILVLLFLPVLGLLLYFFFGRDTRKERMIGRRMLSQIQRRQLNDDTDNQAEVPQGYEPLVAYLRNSSSACLVARVMYVYSGLQRSLPRHCMMRLMPPRSTYTYSSTYSRMMSSVACCVSISWRKPGRA